MTGLAIECATEHVEVLVESADGSALAVRVEDIGHGHTRRLAPLVRAALAEAGVTPIELDWIAADLGPGSFTGVRVGLATARAIAMVAGARLRGASSLAALAHAYAHEHKRKALIVPLVSAGRRDVYAGYFHGDRKGDARLVMAPSVGPASHVIALTAEARHALGAGDVRFVGPAAERERTELEAAWPGSVDGAFRATGLSAADLARAARLTGGAPHGLPRANEEPAPIYVRPAQAEDRVRHRALAGTTILLRDMTKTDVTRVAEIEKRVFPDPWPESFFVAELRQDEVFARIAERDGALAGYSMAWLGRDFGHLGNIAVVPEQRRRGVAAALIDELVARMRATGVKFLTLEVRASNAAAQALYRSRGFRVAALRRRYYRDNGEDALVMEWRTVPSPSA